MDTVALSELYEQVFSHTHEGVWVLDRELKTVITNAGLARILQTNEADLKHKTPLEYIPFDTNNHFYFEIQSWHPEPRESIEFKLKLNGGNYVWCSIRMHITYEKGVPSGKIVFFTDITKTKRIQKDQLENLRTYYSLFEESPIPIWDEDFSEVKKHIDLLKEQGVHDFETYLQQHPEEIEILASKMIVNKINQAVVKLNEAKSKEQVLEYMHELRTEDFHFYIIRQVVAIANQERSCEFNAALKTIKGNIRHVLFKWTVVKGHEKNYSHIYLTTTDLTNRIIEENIQLQRSNREKEILLREIHHRVKNNFQIISSLIRLQAASIANEQLESVLQVLLNRIYSMATVHELLYRSNELEIIQLQDYLAHLIQLLIESLNVESDIEFELQTHQVAITLDQASPFGLIINELITNSIKHAFHELTSGKLYIHARIAEDGHIEVEIGDNGSGISEQDVINDSLGLNLVDSLVEQLNARLIRVDKQPGTHYRLILNSMVPVEFQKD